MYLWHNVSLPRYVEEALYYCSNRISVGENIVYAYLFNKLSMIYEDNRTNLDLTESEKTRSVTQLVTL